MLLPQPALVALAAKYEALIALRRARDGDNGEAVSAVTKEQLRRLSQAYPGCLRELDRCSLALLTQRLEDVRAAIDGNSTAPWIGWMWRYHELLRIALQVKRGNTTHLPELVAFLAACQAPPAGKLVPLVWEQLERETRTPASLLAETLFPSRRQA